MSQPPERGAPPPGRWPWQRTLLNRLIFTYGLIFLAILALLMLYVGRAVYRVQLDQIEHALEVEAFLVANALEDPLSGYAVEFEEYERYEQEHEAESHQNSDEEDEYESDGHESDDHEDDSDVSSVNRSAPARSTTLTAPTALRLQQLAQWYAQDTGARVSILEIGGDVIADSAVPPLEVGNQLHQIEVQAALTGKEQHAVRIDPLTGEETPLRGSSHLAGRSSRASYVWPRRSARSVPGPAVTSRSDAGRSAGVGRRGRDQHWRCPPCRAAGSPAGRSGSGRQRRKSDTPLTGEETLYAAAQFGRAIILSASYVWPRRSARSARRAGSSAAI